MDADILVVGAGPAGVAAGITARRRGLTAIVVDRATFPRDKFCGDGLTANALRELSALGLTTDALPSWRQVDRALVRSPSGRTVEFPMPVGQGAFAVVVRRYELDRALVQLAREHGVTVLEGHELTELTQDADGVTATAGDATLRARYAIAADGMWSPTRKALGLRVPGEDDRYLGDWHAFRQYYRNVTGRAKGELIVSFEADIVPGYFWSFPLGDGSVNVGFGIDRATNHTTREMKRLWPDLLARPHIRELLGPDAEPEGPHRAWPIPAAVDRAQATSGRTLFAGDAVAACDPMTGEGIGQALQTGRMAAEAIAETPEFPSLVRARYERELDRSLRADHAMSELLVRALKHRKGARAAVRVAGATAWTRRNFARWLFEDYPRAILLTPRRWRGRPFSRPGALFD